MKSISILFSVLLTGLFFIACKDAKTNGTEENTESAALVITTDSLQGLKDDMTRSINTMQSILAQKIAETEANIAATDNETAKQELNTFLEKLRKVETNLQTSLARTAEATSDTWVAIEEEIMPYLYETKSILTTGGLTTTPQTSTSGAEKK